MRTYSRKSKLCNKGICPRNKHQVLTAFLILQGCLATGPTLKESVQERKIQSDRTKRKKMLQDAIETLKKFEIEQLGAEKEESSKTK